MIPRAAALLSCVVAAGAPVTLSTYIGVADCDGIAVWNGDAFLACHSPESRLPIRVRGSRSAPNVMAAFVLRLNLRTGRLVYATRIGGSDFTAAFRIKVDKDGFAWATGFTKARDFPTTSSAVQREYAGGDSDAFLVGLSPSGAIVYSSLIGGAGADQGNGLELDRQGVVFVAGTTWRDGHGDPFVARVRPADRSSLRMVVFGGAKEEKLTGLALDGRGGLFAVGYTTSADFPVFHPVQDALRGVSDLFLVRLDAATLETTFSTYLGGSGDDSGWGLSVDRMGNPVVSGITDSRDLPVSDNAFQRQSAGGLDAFVARFEGPEYATLRLTYFGGSKDDSSGYDGENIKLDAEGNVWLVGLTASSDLPVQGAGQRTHGGDSDGFVVSLSPQLEKMCFSNYHGGSDRDLLEGIDVAADGTIVATGVTFSEDLGTTGNARQRSLATVRVGHRVANAIVVAFRIRNACGGLNAGAR